MKKVLLTSILFCLYIEVFSQAEVFIIRHAESTSATDHSPLISTGFIRSYKLESLFSKSKITRIFITNTLRSKQTAEPLWRSIGGTPNQMVIYNSYAHLRTLIASDIAAGRRILIVGHSNTVPQIISALGVAPPILPDLNGNDDLFEVIYRGVNRELIHLKYGL